MAAVNYDDDATKDDGSCEYGDMLFYMIHGTTYLPDSIKPVKGDVYINNNYIGTMTNSWHYVDIPPGCNNSDAVRYTIDRREEFYVQAVVFYNDDSFQAYEWRIFIVNPLAKSEAECSPFAVY